MNLPDIPGYTYDELIGEGACGYVYRCTGSTGEERAVKILKTLAINADLVGTMYGRLSRAPSHPGIARIHAQNFGKDPFFYAMTLYGERMRGRKQWNSPSLEPFIGEIACDQAIAVVDQLADAIAFLHRNEIIHAGLKPSNVFLLGDAARGFEVKVTDIGQGFVRGPQYLQMGDAGFYASPEQLADGAYEEGAGRRWDVYAFGVLAFRIMTGRFPRLEDKHRQYLKEQDENAKTPAAVFGEVGAGDYQAWIAAEPRVVWPTPAESETEKARRLVIERCLHLDPEHRYPDMREVIDEFKTRDHQIVLARIQQAAYDEQKRESKKAIRWRRFSVAAGVVAAGIAIAAGIFYLQWRITQDRMTRQSITGKETIEEEREKFDEALNKLAKEQKSEIDEVAHSAQEFRETAERAEALLSHARRNGDRFFELVLETRESDLPGYEMERSLALIKGRKYYEELAGVLGNDPGQVETTANAYRFLGAIYRELGDLKNTEAALRQANARFGVVRQGEGGQGERGLRNLKSLADVNRELAEVIPLNRGKAGTADAELFLRESDAIWRSLLASDTESIEFRMEIARNELVRVNLLRVDGKPIVEQLAAAQRAADALVRLQEKSPLDDEVMGLLADSLSRIGDLLTESDRRPEALDVYEQAAEIYASATKLNGAIERYQFFYGKMLAEVARGKGDPDKLAAASKVLAYVAAEEPQNVEIQAEMARSWGTLAEWQRDGGKASEAMALEVKATQALAPLILGDDVNDEAVTPMARFILAERFCHLSELQGDAGQYDESLKSVDKAVALLKELLKIDPQENTYQRKLAEALGLAGFACAKGDKKDNAKKLYTAALDQWQRILNINAADPIAEDGASWVKSQLESL